MTARQSQNTIGSRIAEARLEKKWSQAELARQAGLTRSAIAQLESGLSKSPTPENMFRLADALGIDARDLTFGAGQSYKSTEQSLADLLTLLPPEQRQEAMDFTLYKIEKSETLFVGEKLTSYLTMVDKVKQDMARKKRGGTP